MAHIDVSCNIIAAIEHSAIEAINACQKDRRILGGALRAAGLGRCLLVGQS